MLNVGDRKTKGGEKRGRHIKLAFPRGESFFLREEEWRHPCSVSLIETRILKRKRG